MPQILSLCVASSKARVPLEPVLCNKRSHHSEKPALQCEEAPLTTGEEPATQQQKPSTTEKKKKKKRISCEGLAVRKR